MAQDTVWLLIGCKPTEKWPLVTEKFNAEPTAWTAYDSEDKALTKKKELEASEEHITEWKVVPRRVE